MPLTLKDYYTSEEVAERLNVSVKTVYRWMYEGKLNAERIGRMVYFDCKTVDELPRHATRRSRKSQ